MSYPCSILILLLYWRSLHVDGGAEDSSYQQIVTVSSLLPSEACSSTPQDWNDEKRLRLVHLHGPCSLSSLSHDYKEKEKFDHQKILYQDQYRIDSLNHHRISTASSRRKKKAGKGPRPSSSEVSIASSRRKKKAGKGPRPSSSEVSIPAHTGTAFSTANFIVTVGFGTPKKYYSVIFDTGSDVTWIQCKPCASSCYPQEEPLFDPAESSTYSNISCTSPYCSQLSISSCSRSGSNCIYGVQYGDNSYTIGFFAEDTLTLSPSDGDLPKFRFGCGQNNQGLFGKSAGLLGLGRRPLSLVSQSLYRYGGVFSYCLPSTSSSTGYLSFGSSASTNAAAAKFTPMLAEADSPSFYFLNLTAIRVGGRQLSVPPAVFIKSGTIIDSGTVITRLPPTAYSALRSTFRKLMAKYPTAPALAILDTCYDFTGYETVSLPTVDLVFAGSASVNLDSSGIVYVANVSQVCLAFAGNSAADDLCILGNVQQRTLGVVYDVSKKLVGFAPGSCS